LPVPFARRAADETGRALPRLPAMAPSVKEVLTFIGRSSKRIAVTVVGAAAVAAGLAMLVLPGPGILVVALGFAILGTEYAWAASALERTKGIAERGGRMVTGAAKSASGRVRKRPPPKEQ
jgi:putative transmembrane protein PGPGW